MVSILRITIASILILSLAGCAGATEGKRRGWHGGAACASRCAAECAEWDSEGKVCLQFHEWTSRRCAELLSEGLACH